MDNSHKIYQKYLLKYKKQVKSFDEKSFSKFIQEEEKKAKLAYKKLFSPKVYLQKTYILGWVREALQIDLNTKLLQQKGKEGGGPAKYPAYFSLLRFLSKYFKLIPFNIENPNQEQRVYAGDPKRREKKWQKLNLPLGKIEQKFKNVALARSKLGKENGFSSYVELCLDHSKIPQSDYGYFLENVDRVIDYCNQNLPKDKNLPPWFYKEFNLPCFLCRIPNYPFESQKQAVDFMFDKFAILNKYKGKIRIDYKDEAPSNVRYIKETDSFEISIYKKENLRHETASLLHELSHVVAYLNNAKRNINWSQKGKYIKEEEAIRTESKLLRENFPQIFEANLAEVLLTLRRVLFEMELYKNPKQDLNKLYAQTFNHCFRGANQKNNPLFVIDDGIVMRPLRNLHHAVSDVKVLSEIIDGANSK